MFPVIGTDSCCIRCNRYELFFTGKVYYPKDIQRKFVRKKAITL